MTDKERVFQREVEEMRKKFNSYPKEKEDKQKK